MTKFIGFDATEDHRCGKAGTYDSRTTCASCFGKGKTKTGKDCGPCRGTGDLMYDVRYPLREWGWDRAECKRQIAAAGLPVPVKSACFFCPASKQHEIHELPSDLHQLSIKMEDNYKEGKHWRGDKSSTVGLGRKFSWKGLARQRELFGDD